MTTATTEPITALVTFESDGEAHQIKISALVPNPWNRGKGSQEDLHKLAESIKAKGILQPLLLRHHPKQDGKYEIVAGEQRYHGGLLAGREFVPALVREEMTDQDVMDVMEIENLRRVAPSPIQQAELIRQYRLKGYDNHHLAAVLGESRQTLNRREKLLDLSPKWKKAMTDKDSPFSLWTAAHLELIARYEAKMQDEFMHDLHFDDPGEMSPAKLEEYLREKTQALHTFPWKLDDETLVPKAGSCNGCQLRTGALTDLFGEVNGKAGNDDSCMSKPCREKKMAAHITKQIAELKKEHGECVKLSIHHGGSNDGTYYYGNYSLLKNTKDKAKPGVFVDGEKKGSWSWCLVGKDKSSSKPSSSSSNKPAGEPKTSMADRKKALEKRRRCAVLVKLIDWVEAKDLTWDEKDRDYLVSLIYVFGTDNSTGYPRMPGGWKQFHDSLKKKPTANDLWPRIRGVLVDQLRSDLNSREPDLKEAKEIAVAVSADLDAMRKEAENEIPVPKSWAAELAEAKENKPSKADSIPKPKRKPKTDLDDDDQSDPDEGVDGDSEGDV